MDDANDFSWISAKASHAVLLCRMEQGEIKSYADVLAIDRIRRANAQKHMATSVASSSQNSVFPKKFGKTTKSMPSIYFNQGTFCRKNLMRPGGSFISICASCFASAGKTFPHAETECKNKHKGQAKKND